MERGPWLPIELWLAVFVLVDGPWDKIQDLRRVCRQWASGIDRLRLVEMSLVLHVVRPATGSDSFHNLPSPVECYLSKDVPLLILGSGSALSRLFVPTLSRGPWVTVKSTIPTKTILEHTCEAYLKRKAHFPRTWRRLILEGNLGSLDLEEWAFKELTLVSPSHRNALASLPISIENLELLDIVDIHSQLNLNPLFGAANLKHLSLHSDGRLLDDTGHLRFSSFSPLVALTLDTLNFEGPWIQNMMDYPLGLFNVLGSLKSLRHLIIDLDYQTLGPEVIINLFNALPHLKTFGRLGRVDKSFWRLAGKALGARLETLVIGSVKYPYSHRLTHNQAFCKDLALGVLWFAPSLVKLEVWMGFYGEETSLLAALSRLKEGPEWLLPPTVQEVRRLKRIDIYQMLDTHSLQDERGWRRLAEMPASRPVTVNLSSRDTLEPGHYRRFGPAL